MKKDNKSFEEYYKLYEPIIEQFRISEYQRYNKYGIRFLIEIIILIVISLSLIHIIHINHMIVYFEKLTILLSLVLLVVLCILNKRLLDKERQDSCYVVNALIYNFILEYLTSKNFSFEINKQITVEDFNKMKLFNMEYLNFIGGNITFATYEDKKLLMCDVWLYDLVERIKRDKYYSKSSRTTYITNYYYQDRVDIFKGLYYETTINQKNKQYIYLIPNNIKDKFIQKNIYHYISYDGVKVELENLDFSEKYSVFSIDEIKSRCVLSLTFMEKINMLDKLIDNKKYIVFKPDGRVGIFIDGFQLDKMFRKSFKLNCDIPKNHIKEIYIKINKLLDISSVLEDIDSYK